MDPSQLFRIAAPLGKVERLELLERVCQGDSQLRASVEFLLASHDQQVQTSDQADGSSVPRAAPPVTATWQPATLASGLQLMAGKYKLVQHLGEGGMGSVWLAEQGAPVKRQVAVKLIKIGMDSRAVLARFEAERTALAMMDHPNIAKILDGGLTESGAPFFVMELVKGKPITQFCDAGKFTVPERLKLFASVCQAVQHAHQKGIIHRDIKPSNVLVCLVDDKPVPKLIDFGLAKATGQALTEQTLHTGLHVVGTPQYMSPEQATFEQLDIDTRSDIYSLGVLLYELLAGVPPFTRHSLEQSGLVEFLRKIREDDPPRPSANLAASADLPKIASHRRCEPSSLIGMLRRDLDWIAMKALEKDRARRYATANALAADIQRYLAGEAVLAHPPTAAYQIGKLLRKHRGLVAAVGLLVLALTAGVIGTSIGLVHANIQRGNADSARKAALASQQETQQRAEELQAVADFQAAMLAQIDPTLAGSLLMENLRGGFAEGLKRSDSAPLELDSRIARFSADLELVNATDTARDLIDRTLLRPAVAAVAQQFSGQPRVAAQLQQVLATLYRNLGLLDAATPLQDSALAARREALGELHPETLDSLENQAILWEVQGKLKEAEPLYRHVLEARRRILGEAHSDTLTAINNLGGILWSQGNYSEAEPFLRESAQKSREVLGDEHPRTLAALGFLGVLLQDQGNFAEAERCLRESLDIKRRVLGNEHPSTLVSLNNLAVLLQDRQQLMAAEPLFREAMETKIRILGLDHPDTAISIDNLAMVLDKLGRRTEAEGYYRQALDGFQRLLGREHPDTLVSVNNLATLLRDLGKLDEASKYLQENIEISSRVLGPEHPNTLVYLLNHASVLKAQGKNADVVDRLTNIEASVRRVYADDNAWRLGVLYLTLGSARRELGDLEAAEQNLLEAEALLAKTLGAKDPTTRNCVQALVDLYTIRGQSSPGQGHEENVAHWSARLNQLATDGEPGD